MNFRRRVALLAAAAVAVAVLLASALSYLLVAHQLRGQVDAQLRDRAHDAAFLFRHVASNSSSAPLLLGTTPRQLLGLPPRPNEVRGYQQLVTSSGAILGRSGNARVTLPVDAATRRLAAHGGRSFFGDARVDDIHLRILAESVRPGLAVQFGQPLTEADHLLSRLRLILILIALGGIALAALLGGLVARAVVAPVGRLTRAAEHVARTQDLSGRIEADRADEIGRLAVSFNAMLDALGRSMGALDASVHAQRQLVADASHELRTPVTSLRTNIEILQQAHDLHPAEREQLYTDVVEQIEELTLLVNDLIDLARGEEPPADTEDVRLDQIVRESLDRAHRHAPESTFEAELAPTLLPGVPARLGRAVNNLLDNAVKYSPPGRPVEIRLTGHELTVRDHGPGIADADLPHIFDRFYRGAEARGRPGSGLGLAIVRQVVEQHGGTIAASAAAGGGTAMRVHLPRAETLPGEPAAGGGAAGGGAAGGGAAGEAAAGGPVAAR
ncbi:MAG TPA: HAMP domain-containing sensor histidine kinase [Solirubrobacteraceae bacterium]|jgi:two-component system sensor histidine kinase MprB|nr:HAMP domain-containing sensor histidine kinase [Solirubrobacteraceae bacterium]